jgi:hypothetical protein
MYQRDYEAKLKSLRFKHILDFSLRLRSLTISVRQTENKKSKEQLRKSN